MNEYHGPDSSGSPENQARGPEIGHACNSCRRRKLRCSRELPACQHCRKTVSDCHYETTRAKPGMKAGALDNIHRRLDAIERSVGRQQARIESFEGEGASPQNDSALHTILSSLAAGLQKLDKRPAISGAGPSLKRPRHDSDGAHYIPLPTGLPPIPDDTVLSHVLEAYFIYVHPWTPIVHESRLRRRLVEDHQREKLHLVVYSMILVAARYIEDGDTAAYLSQLVDEPENMRDWLVSQAMKQPSVENLQALVMVASDDIGSGHTARAWPLVGSLSRMVEYLQLTVEHDEAVQHPFSQPYRSLSSPADWTEAEERRRIFWGIFALDRFCSVSMGWNTSLTADDVRRRLPCDGITWRKEDPVVTPYFGIWDKSAGRIGNPIAFLPAHPAPARPAAEEEADGSISEAGTSPVTASAAVDMSTVGAYAYCIEATESLSRVTTYFLQQKVNLNDQKDFGAWLTRFKELDLRLVHWKMLLPHKWTVNVSPSQSACTRMDPNLTLAHVTHNASMILLHQPIAFPLCDWPFKSRLPSHCSMDTCQTAAIEVATITNHYLKGSLQTAPLNSQFAFCVFIAGRALLLYWQHGRSQEAVVPEFWMLTQSLDTMSTRWAGTGTGTGTGVKNLAAKYSSTLTQLHSQTADNESFSISISAYTTEVMHLSEQQSPSSNHPTMSPKISGTPAQTHNPSTGNQTNPAPNQGDGLSPPQSRSSNSNMPQPIYPNPEVAALTPGAFTLNMGMSAHNNAVPNILRPDLAGDSDDPVAMSQMLLDQQFTGLDRVISYSDGLFGSDFEGRRW
ncbi:Zn(II)2Cys6 transcription factor [Aspergillus puulaauensis]|uniref:Zn(2)-C6 fungal-type domain-containing protein n=1 Tax=Aspergillus puulaauensis TaxID=1220207 RepID=A0A7R7XIN4_9EURO|nr:uncharacterized protein APUU_22195A [Aspergillus puulaauensis]BCS21763.1 hypothetical protein APUU_22195A [Aspergillus puulaauensis]